MRQLVIILAGMTIGAYFSLAAGQQPPNALAQCQSVLRVKQDLVTYSEQLAASLLLRAEKAEQELAVVKQQLEAQQSAPKDKE